MFSIMQVFCMKYFIWNGVLVAISIPIFTTQLEKSREAVDLANIRAAYAECAADVLTDVKSTYFKKVDPKQATAGWISSPDKIADSLDITTDTVGKTIVSGTPVYVQVTPAGVVSVVTTKPTESATVKDADKVGTTTPASGS